MLRVDSVALEVGVLVLDEVQSRIREPSLNLAVLKRVGLQSNGAIPGVSGITASEFLHWEQQDSSSLEEVVCVAVYIRVCWWLDIVWA